MIVFAGIVKLNPAVNIFHLSSELMYMVLSLIPLPSLLTAALVCKRWRMVVENPLLWASNSITLDKANIQCLRIHWLARLGKVTLHSVNRKVLKEVLRHPAIQEMVIKPSMSFSKVDPNLLATVVARMEAVECSSSDLVKETI